MVTMVATLAPKPVHRLYPVLRAPFAADTWRRTGYALVALPVAIASVPLALAGGPGGRLQRRAAGLLPGGKGTDVVRPRAGIDAVQPHAGTDAADGHAGTDAVRP